LARTFWRPPWGVSKTLPDAQIFIFCNAYYHIQLDSSEERAHTLLSRAILELWRTTWCFWWMNIVWSDWRFLGLVWWLD